MYCWKWGLFSLAHCGTSLQPSAPLGKGWVFVHASKNPDSRNRITLVAQSIRETVSQSSDESLEKTVKGSVMLIVAYIWLEYENDSHPTIRSSSKTVRIFKHNRQIAIKSRTPILTTSTVGSDVAMKAESQKDEVRAATVSSEQRRGSWHSSVEQKSQEGVIRMWDLRSR